MKKMIIVFLITTSTIFSAEPIDSLMQHAVKDTHVILTETEKKAEKAAKQAYETAYQQHKEGIQVAHPLSCESGLSSKRCSALQVENDEQKDAPMPKEESSEEPSSENKSKRTYYRESIINRFADETTQLKAQFDVIREQALSSEGDAVALKKMKNDWLKSCNQLAQEAADVVLTEDIQDFTNEIKQQINGRKLELRELTFTEEDTTHIVLATACIKALEKRQESMNPSFFEYTTNRIHKACDTRIAQSPTLHKIAEKVSPLANYVGSFIKYVASSLKEDVQTAIAQSDLINNAPERIKKKLRASSPIKDAIWNATSGCYRYMEEAQQ